MPTQDTSTERQQQPPRRTTPRRTTPRADKVDAVRLVALKAFSAFGVDYNKGDAIKARHLNKWPPGTLDRRIANGFCRFGDPSAAVTSGIFDDGERTGLGADEDEGEDEGNDE